MTTVRVKEKQIEVIKSGEAKKVRNKWSSKGLRGVTSRVEKRAPTYVASVNA